MLVSALVLCIAFIVALLLAFDESNLDASIGPLPLGTYLGALAGMEAALAVSWGTAKLAARAHRARQRRG